MLKPSMFQKGLRFKCYIKKIFGLQRDVCPDLLNRQGCLQQLKLLAESVIFPGPWCIHLWATPVFSPASYLNHSQKLCSHGIFIKALAPRQTSHKYNIATVINIQNNLNYLCVVFYLRLCLSHGFKMESKTMTNITFLGKCYIFGSESYIFQW